METIIPTPVTQEDKPVTNNTPYIIAITVMIAIAVLGITLVEVLHEGDNTATIAAIIGILTPTTLSLLAFLKAQETHLSVNSRLDNFIETSKAIGTAQGLAEGKVLGRDEANARNDALDGAMGRSNDPHEKTVVKSGDEVVIKKIK